MLDGLAALQGAALAAEETRLLAAGARAAADLAALPAAARPGAIPDAWEQAAASFADRARAIPATTGMGSPTLPPSPR